jgi:tetratricopeptide (TPR) repeat protein
MSRIWYLLLLSWLCTATDAKSQSCAAFTEGIEWLAGAGFLIEAAERYERLSAQRPGRDEMLYQAAECRFKARDYARAAECFAQSATVHDRHPAARLHHARALKQCGRYAEAMVVFEKFSACYDGPLRETALKMTALEIEGCKMGIAALPPLETLTRLPDAINTAGKETAPLPWSDEAFYFTRQQGRKSEMFRSLSRFGIRQTPEPAEKLPQFLNNRFGSGAFSPDGKRFYCTECDPAPAAAPKDLRPQCTLYVLRRTAEGWRPPEALRRYINLPGYTALYPAVAQFRGKEWLFFASDRPGGFGGLDLYACERNLDADDLDFSLPQNLGNAINTPGDELTPFFDAANKTLWFSSNGHCSFGGLDVQKSVFQNERWSVPENAGLPVNSPADDYFYVSKKRGGAYLVSNRANGKKECKPGDWNIFELEAPDVHTLKLSR